jgi:hypothetical protein
LHPLGIKLCKKIDSTILFQILSINVNNRTTK